MAVWILLRSWQQAIVATMVSTGVGVIFCLLMQKKSSG